MSNLSEVLRATARRQPDDVALVEVREGRRVISWAEFDAECDKVARALSGHGLRAGQRVAIAMINRIDMAIGYFGILRGGMVAVPINTRATDDETAAMLLHSSAGLVLCDEFGIDSVRAVGNDDLQIVVRGVQPEAEEITLADFLAKASHSAPVAPVDPEARAVILYTLGTSSSPRGAVLSHRALLASLEQLGEVTPEIIGPEDVSLGLLPMCHAYGLNAILGQSVYAGATVVLVDRFVPDELLHTIGDEAITVLPIAPPVVAAWVGRDDLRESLHGVRLIISGAAWFDPDLAQSFFEASGHHIEQGYGQTETAAVISSTVVGLADRPAGTGPSPGSVGPPVPGVEVVIREAGPTAAEAGDPGEIWVRGNNLFSGYWPDGADGPSDDGWLATGDIGFVTESGELVVVDRLREIVTVSGFNVYPMEVEDVLAELEPVQAVGVVSVPDQRTGEAVVAFVVARSDDDEEQVQRLVRDHAAARLARFKQPSRIVVVRDLPHSTTGKVAKERLRAMARESAPGLDVIEPR